MPLIHYLYGLERIVKPSTPFNGTDNLWTLSSWRNHVGFSLHKAIPTSLQYPMGFLELPVRVRRIVGDKSRVRPCENRFLGAAADLNFVSKARWMQWSLDGSTRTPNRVAQMNGISLKFDAKTNGRVIGVVIKGRLRLKDKKRKHDFCVKNKLLLRSIELFGADLWTPSPFGSGLLTLNRMLL